MGIKVNVNFVRNNRMLSLARTKPTNILRSQRTKHIFA